MLTDDHLDAIESRTSLHNSDTLALIAEVRRLRKIEAAQLELMHGGDWPFILAACS